MNEIRSTWVFGKAAVQMGLVSARNIEEAAQAQEEMESEGVTLRFGEILAEGKLMDADAIQKVLAARSTEVPDPDEALFGAIAVENGFITREDLAGCVDLQQEIASEIEDPTKVPKIGEIALTEEKMTPAGVEAVLKVQTRLKIGAWALSPSKLLVVKKRKEQPLKVRNPEEMLLFKMAVRRQKLAPQQVEEILKAQREDPQPKPAMEVAYELGFLDQIEIANLLEAVGRKEGVQERRRKHQTTAGIKIVKEDAEFSNIALANGLIEKPSLKKSEAAYKVVQFLGYPRSLGEVMFDMGFLSTDKIRVVLDVMRHKGAILPAYRLDEILLTEKEDEALLAHCKEDGKITQKQVAECLKIQKELRKVGIQRRLGEIMIVKSYLFREDIRKPVVKRERGRKAAARKQAGFPILPVAVVAGLAIVALIVVLAMMSGGGGGDGGQGRKPSDGGGQSKAGQQDPQEKPGDSDKTPTDPEAAR